MSVKYHISPKTGKAKVCRAEKRPCRLGGVDEHYTSLQDAQAAEEKRYSEALGLHRTETQKTDTVSELQKAQQAYLVDTAEIIANTSGASKRGDVVAVAHGDSVRLVRIAQVNGAKFSGPTVDDEKIHEPAYLEDVPAHAVLKAPPINA